MFALTCEMETECYPHPGCAEFGPPDVFRCQARAVFVAYLSSPFGEDLLLLCEQCFLAPMVSDDLATWGVLDAGWVNEHVLGAVDAAMREWTETELLIFAYEGGDAAEVRPYGSDAYAHGWWSMLALLTAHIRTEIG